MRTVLNIPGTMTDLNTYIGAERRNRHIAAKIKADETLRVKLLAARLPRFTKPVKLVFTWREKDARKDPDNIIFAKKFILDGLKEAGTIPQDSQKWIKGIAESWIIDPTNPGIEVLIIEQE